MTRIQTQRGRIETKARDGNHSHYSLAISINALEIVVELSEPKTSPPFVRVLF